MPRLPVSTANAISPSPASQGGEGGRGNAANHFLIVMEGKITE